MKLRRILAAAAAAAVATSAMAISAFAAIDTNIDLLAEGYDVTEIYGVTFILDGDVDAGVGGGIGFNSPSTGWEDHEWGNADAGKEYTASSDGVLTLMKDAPVFLESDATDPENPYAQVWIQSWWGEIALSEVIMLDADGNAIVLDDGAADDEAADEGTAEADDTVVDEGTAEAGDAEDGDIVEDGVAAEVDWTAYDADAMAANNDEFVYGTSAYIDLYDFVGDSWTDLAKIDATFVWTAGTDWNGGAGLGNGATLADGTNWIAGPELGTVNANAGIVDDGVATQTILDLTETPLATIATVGEDGTSAFAQLQIQSWWNVAEAGAQLAVLTAYDAEGNVIGEIEYMDVPAADDGAADDGAVDTDADTGAEGDKGSADTGVEGIAAVAGVVALAGAAVVASRKRK